MVILFYTLKDSLVNDVKITFLILRKFSVVGLIKLLKDGKRGVQCNRI